MVLGVIAVSLLMNVYVYHVNAIVRNLVIVSVYVNVIYFVFVFRVDVTTVIVEKKSLRNGIKIFFMNPNL